MMIPRAIWPGKISSYGGEGLRVLIGNNIAAGQAYPTEPKTAFYDWLYLTALRQNPERAAVLLEYDGFTDIEFNPQKSLNCQAKAAALYVSLCRNGLLTEINDFEDFLRILRGETDV